MIEVNSIIPVTFKRGRSRLGEIIEITTPGSFTASCVIAGESLLFHICDAWYQTVGQIEVKKVYFDHTCDTMWTTTEGDIQRFLITSKATIEGTFHVVDYDPARVEK